jgi:hypothetical protein
MRNHLLRYRVRDDFYYPLKFTARIFDTMRLERGALAACCVAEGMGAPAQCWKIGDDAHQCIAWWEYCWDAAGAVTVGLRALHSEFGVGPKANFAAVSHE